jgi:SAM-dependent methyltransferase
MQGSSGLPPTAAGLGLPSGWVRRFAHLVPKGGRVLDMAAGGGRHTRFMVERGHPVTSVDRNLNGMQDLAGRNGITLIEADLEADAWPLTAQRFDAIIVTNYLYRPLLPILQDWLTPGGVLIYETFAEGNQAFGSPSNPDFLLRPNELLTIFSPHLMVVGFEQGIVYTPRPASIQRIAAVAGQVPVPL